MSTAQISFASGDVNCVRATNLPNYDDLAFCCWLQVVSYENYGDVFSLDNGNGAAGRYIYLEYDAAGNLYITSRWDAGAGGTDTQNLWTDARADWNFVALSAETGIIRSYFMSAGGVWTVGPTIAPAAAWTPTGIALGIAPAFPTEANGAHRYRGVKIFNSSKTEGELQAEAFSTKPRSLSAITFFNAALDPSTLNVDMSGTGGDMTLVGVPTASDSDPGVPWQATKASASAGTPPVAAPSALLLSEGPTGHYLVTAAGQPVLLVGDSAWCAFTSLTLQEFEAYCDNRQAKGVNLINVEIIEHLFSIDAPNNAYGDPPFLTPGDITTPNPAYFNRIAGYVAAAAERDIIVNAFIFYLGFGGGSEGWYADGVAAGATAVQNFCEYVANLLKNAPNLIWSIGGDFMPPSMALPDACAAGIAAVDSAHLVTANWARNSSSHDGSPSWLTVCSTYTDEVVYPGVIADYEFTPALTTFLVEAVYEETGVIDSQVARQELWPAVLSGAAGAVYGADGVWQFSAGWEALLDLPGAVSIEHFASLFRSVNWWELAPDLDSDLVQAATRGTFGSIGYVTAAKIPDGSLAIIYLSDGGSITVNLSGQMTTPTRARWYNPFTGVFTTVAGSPFSGATQSFTAPAAHAEGTDWVLVLDPEP